MILDVVLMCPLQICFLNIHNILCIFLKDSGLPHYETVYVYVLCMILVKRWLIITNMCVNKCVLFKVWRISLQGPCYMTLLMIAFGLLWGHLLQIRPTQSVFISTCLSLSSTPLVSRFLVGSARGEKEGRRSHVLSYVEVLCVELT